MYDAVIIGGGPAGVAAGVYAARKQMKTLFITKDFNSQSIVSASIENWIGMVSIAGWEFGQALEKHLRAQEGIEIKTGTKVSEISEMGGDYAVKIDEEERYESKIVIIASGGRHRHLEVPGEEKLQGKGVSYCSTCDAPFFRGKKVAVVGGGNAGLEAVEDLLSYADEIVLIVRSGELRGDQITRDRILTSPKVSVLYKTLVEEILGENNVIGVRIKNSETGEIKKADLNGVFVEIGMVPNTEFVRDLVDLNERGEIMLDHRTRAASKPGIFAAGDVTDALYKQNNISAGDGVAAALSAYDYLRKKKS